MREPRHPIPLKPPLSTRVGYVHYTEANTVRNPTVIQQIGFYRASAYWRDIDIANLSVRLSVCLSVRYAPVPDENGLTYRQSFFFQNTVAQSLYFYHHQTFSQNSDGWNIKISRFSMNKWLYLANDTIYRHSYHGKRIGTRMRSIKWWHFQWPWTKPNPVFKVTPLFDANYLTNGYRYGHRTHAFKWHQFK